MTGEYNNDKISFTSQFIPFSIKDVFNFSFPTSWFSENVTLWDIDKKIITSGYSLNNHKVIKDGYVTFFLDESKAFVDEGWKKAKYIRFSFYGGNKNSIIITKKNIYNDF